MKRVSVLCLVSLVALLAAVVYFVDTDEVTLVSVAFADDDEDPTPAPKKDPTPAPKPEPTEAPCWTTCHDDVCVATDTAGNCTKTKYITYRCPCD